LFGAVEEDRSRLGVCRPVLRIGPYRFFFYSMEGREPPHIHVERDENVAKYWLEPVGLVSSQGFRSHELTRVRIHVSEHRELFLEAWHVHFDIGRDGGGCND